MFTLDTYSITFFPIFSFSPPFSLSYIFLLLHSFIPSFPFLYLPIHSPQFTLSFAIVSLLLSVGHLHAYCTLDPPTNSPSLPFPHFPPRFQPWAALQLICRLPLAVCSPFDRPSDSPTVRNGVRFPVNTDTLPHPSVHYSAIVALASNDPYLYPRGAGDLDRGSDMDAFFGVLSKGEGVKSRWTRAPSSRRGRTCAESIV